MIETRWHEYATCLSELEGLHATHYIYSERYLTHLIESAIACLMQVPGRFRSSDIVVVFVVVVVVVFVVVVVVVVFLVV